MLASDALSENPISSTLSSKCITRHSNSPGFQKKRSSNLLVTSDLSGVHSEQDKVPSICSSKQLPYTNAYSKTNNSVSSNSICIDRIDNDNVESNRSIKAATASQALYGSTSITSVAVEETEIGSKQSYAVLIGQSVRTVNTKLYASLPVRNKFMVKQREQNLFGRTIVKLVLKSSHESCVREEEEGPMEQYVCDNDVEADGNCAGIHHPGNNRRAGYIIYTRDRKFHGDIKYPLPNEKAATSRIGKGGNGSVFIIYHEKKQYAVKQTVYRPNEVNIHSALRHVNVLPLLAVLMGTKHEKHSGRFYCYHFMPRMDYDLRQILSTKEVGCLKYFYRNNSKNRAVFERAFGNVKYTLKETLKALAFIHSNGYVHRDVKASNIMIRMNCTCNPLYCDCTSKFQVKLGDFDSSGTVPGLNIKEPTDQLIKFASILPLGTPGYRAPEVSMHITLSGPYETLYTTAVDMWSFGCLCLNICIGKTAALSQREEASLLLSTTHHCGEELWTKTTKIHEIQRTQPFSSDTRLLKLIKLCLQVNHRNRPSALQSQAYL